MNRAFLLAGGAILVAYLSGCIDPGVSSPSDDSGAPSLSPATTGIEAYCNGVEALDDRWCTYATKCCSTADLSDPFFSLPGCTQPASDATLCESHLQGDLDGGAIVVDPAAVSGCLQDLAAVLPAPPATCSGTMMASTALTLRPLDPVQLPSCRAAIQGTLPEGAACTYDVDCAAGLRCTTTPAITPTICRPAVTDGGWCIENGDCVDGLTCILSPVQGHTGGACGPLGAAGAACLDDTDCQAGLACAVGVTLPPVCTAQGSPGDSCNPNEMPSCGYLAACNDTSSTCASLLANGASCTSSDQCLGRCDLTGDAGTCVDMCGGTR